MFGRAVTVKRFGQPIAVLTVAAPAVDRGDQVKPDHGVFLGFDVTWSALAGQLYEYSPYEFYVRDAGGARFEATGRREPRLGSGTLVAGDRVRGWLSFDAPAHGALVYAPNSAGPAVAEWRF